MANILQCGTHGEREARFVCDHLFRKLRAACPQRLIYFEPAHATHEPTPAIWCEGCEAVIQAEGEINELAHEVACFHAVCDFCFECDLDAGEPAPVED
ncbi:hypothetical protein [Aquimonas voraii]|uniref:Uncharacterized protein n=1 Tax=Aquimonas voraii TaxID=265719 RepID=A0A1G6SQU6_9GAMM|nr:hypothetical protein [Aquimonas voraii]SDD18971.1 hypothetical protein SAMN04488509_101633 [Aquimonas voraii]